MADKRRIRVYCKNLSRWFKSISSAAEFANVDAWSMSKKMETSGSFIDRNGNEYIREKPMQTKNRYQNTGKTLKRKCDKRVRRKPVNQLIAEHPIKEKEFVYGELPKVIRELIDEKIKDMCDKNRPWLEIKAFMLKMGCKQITISLKDTDNEK